MNKRMFVKEQIEELLKNENVARCSEKAISYNQNFKIRAVKQYNEYGMSPREIFRQAGFNLEVTGKERADDCLLRWRRSFRKKGAEGLSEVRGKNGRGGRLKTKDATDADKIKRLEAEVAYLKAENDFLAKLRAKRRE
jgi:transposase-like protein